MKTMTVHLIRLQQEQVCSSMWQQMCAAAHAVDSAAPAADLFTTRQAMMQNHVQNPSLQLILLAGFFL
jgi:hypothetical protein